MVPITTFINKKNGFTLIEVLVTLGIAMLLASILVFNGRSGNRALELKRAAQELVADMRRSQSYSLSTKEPMCEAQGNVIPAWGVEIVHQVGLPGEYYAFGNCNGQPGFQTNTSDSPLSSVLLENIQITVLSPTNLSGGPNKPALDIVFNPPIPTTFIERNSVTTFRIRLTHLDDLSKCLDIRGNSRGNIWIDEKPTSPTCL